MQKNNAMKLVMIKNKYIFKPDPAKKKKARKAKTGKQEEKPYEPNGKHIYAVYKDKKNGETRLVQMTHLYEPIKAKGVKQGYLLPVKLPNVDMPSGVNNSYYTKDVDGAPIDLKKIEAKDVEGKKKKATYIRKSLADKIIRFAKHRRK